MLDVESMTRIRLTGSKRVLDDAIAAMHSAQLVHIQDYRVGKFPELPEGFFDIGRPFNRAGELSEKLVKVRVVLNFLDAAKSIFKEHVLNKETARTTFKKIEPEVIQLHEKETELTEKIKNARSKKKKSETKKYSEDLKMVQLRLRELKEKHGAFLQAYEHSLRSENEKAEAPLRFAVSRNAFIVDGWVPSSNYEKIETALGNKTQGKIHVEKFETEEAPPIRLRNPKVVDAFEFFLEMYSLPKYTELDPTKFIFFTFPFFYGFMLGDWGYGLATLIIFQLAKKKMKGRTAHAFLNAMSVASVGAIIFGFVFGEFFGFVVSTPLIDREHQLIEMLVISLIVGAVHITSAFVLQTMNAIRKKGMIKGLMSGGSWIVIEAGAALLILDSQGYVALPTPYIGYAALLAGVVLLYASHGVHGIIELPALLSNILSYARLFAIGLASVSLAVIMNEIAGEMIHENIYLAPVALLILIMGHGLNIGIGILGGFLQSLRLHYVEYFTKFYEGGGEPYKAFGDDENE